MTIGGWISAGFLSFCVFMFAIPFIVECETAGKVIAFFVAILLSVGIFFGFFWYYNNTAAGQRALVDQESNLSQGLERTINVYTADGDLIATYTGTIDIETNDGGYVKFDFEGKRYIYYNCFVETIAEIG